MLPIAGKLNLPRRTKANLSIAILLTLSFAAAVVGQIEATDPGPRGGSVGAGGPIANLTSDQMRYFNDGQTRFGRPDTVATGLGPVFNADSCGACHAQPSVGGSSPSVDAFPNIGPNPQVALATADNAHNEVPYFITSDGPVREARFKYVVGPNGMVNRNTPDGGVHDLYTIRGRTDAPGCQLAQDNFERAREENNVSFRIPTPTYGAGLIEMIDDGTILANMQSNAAAKAQLGIQGEANRSGNDGTITRFGWKAQNKSLLIFSHEAYNVEVGVTNQIFTQKRGFGGNPPPANCVFNKLPEDYTNYLPLGSDTTQVPSDADAFSTFMRLLDQPTPSCMGANCSVSVQNGRMLFTQVVKCALCHTPSMTTGQSSFTFNAPGLSGVQANLFSDLLTHHMGTGLMDGVSQGNAGPDEFRTAPLWGLGQRVFFLHDGRTRDLLEAIRQHASAGSEANSVIARFNALTEQQKQDLLNFLRSL
jgi:CxxC motif-containing protein (DUF1111 family)